MGRRGPGWVAGAEAAALRGSVAQPPNPTTLASIWWQIMGLLPAHRVGAPSGQLPASQACGCHKDGQCELCPGALAASLLCMPGN